MTQFYLIRHGKRKDMNPDSGLSDTGKKQAKALRTLFKNIDYETIYSSKLERAKETAKDINKYHTNSRYIETELLNEVHASLIGGKIGKDEKRKLMDTKRANIAFKELFEKDHTEKRILIVCHGNIIKYFIKKIFKQKEIDLWHQMHLDSASLTIVEGNKSGLVIKTINNVEHLGPDYKQKFYEKEYDKIK